MKNVLEHKIKLLNISIALFSTLLLFSCDDGFEEMNQNPNVYNEPEIDNLFSYSLLTAGGNPGYTMNYWINDPLYYNLKQAGAYMQYFSSLNTWQWSGDKYLKNTNYDAELYRGTYGTSLKEIQQILELTKDDPELVNKNSITRIMRVYIMHRVTDMYGDVPYFDAGLGYLGQNYKPVFDRQEDIYPDMLKELDEAGRALDSSKPSFGSADFIYGGDVEQWRRFANSLMLRLGMRLTKVDPGMAEEWVTKAIEGGVMENIDDVALLPHTEGTLMNVNPEASEMQGGEGVPITSEGNGYGKMAEAFVEHLKTTDDPRLPFYITLWPGNADPTLLPESTLPEDQRGLPSGYDQSTIQEVIPNWGTSVGYPDISEINLNTVANLSTPTIYMSLSEVELLLAEAALRGWGPGDPESHYERAVKASLDITTEYPGGMSFSTTDIDEYLTSNPYVSGSFEEQMEQIHTQFWVSEFMNNIEVWSNYRRTGYPALTPTNYPGNETGGNIPRRAAYPQEALTLNQENVQEAIQRQGPDLYTTRIWWDSE